MWEKLFDRLLKSVFVIGDVHVTFPNGRIERYGDGSGDRLGLHFHDPKALRALILSPQMAVGEGYMDGTFTIDDDDLRGFLTLALSNTTAGHQPWLMRVLDRTQTLSRQFQQINPIGRAQKNVAHHYDLSGELYDLFLDEDKQYSCAYFRDPGDSLERAQIQKKAHIAGKLQLKPGQRVLDIGCGWGGMALTLARDYGVSVLGVTLSEEQHKVASARAAEAGLSDLVDFHLIDYRKVDGRFDRIVSVGMFEHVGVPHYGEYFAQVRDKLTDDGIALIHTIGRSSPPSYTSAWVRKYIFPGGYVPAMSEAVKAIEKSGLWATDVEIWRLHYAETLRHWHDRFTANRDRIATLYDERFCRMWAYYLIASEMTFRERHQVVFQFQLTRSQHAVPLTRDYMYGDDAATRVAQAAE